MWCEDAGCKMQDARCRMQDAGCKMQDAGCRVLIIIGINTKED